GLWAQLRLQEARRAAGDSVTLSCRASGVTSGDYAMFWYRQAPGGSLEWASLINYSGSIKKYGAAVEGRARASWYSYRSPSSLFLWSLHPSDSACYFCAVHAG
ncbi:HV01 protein, partial [Myiagra hebetior]|nr:HV01 protein [Myiagra hebetior]